jgi:serine/threonine-protein kinase HipA
VELLTVAGEWALLVERYDRVASDEGTVRRLHQEDFRQAMARGPQARREAQSGPGIADCVELIRRTCTYPAEDVIRFLDGVFLNLLLGNGDAHAGSFSLLYSPEAPFVRLAPLHDLVSTAVEPGGAVEAAMAVGGERRPASIDAAAIRRLAEEATLGSAALRDRVHDLAARAPMAAGALARVFRDEGIDEGGGIADRVAATVSENAVPLLRALRGS